MTVELDAQTAVERELVLRLASLLWRLRRATAIESGLLQIQNGIIQEAEQECSVRSWQPDPRGGNAAMTATCDLPKAGRAHCQR